MKTGKHVIFLGAGASHGSGYPLANQLRLLISSRGKWNNALSKYQTQHLPSGRQLLQPSGLSYWDKNEEALKLFRYGGFATVDEFCKLAGNSRLHLQIDRLRCMLRGALGLFNPEENFEKSEYYGFIQNLFKEDLVSLREDTSVLTYNYDPYLEFLLHRALTCRHAVDLQGLITSIKTAGDSTKTHDKIQNHEKSLNAATSGFYNSQNLDWLETDQNQTGFCVLKLHGSISYFADEAAGYKTLFEYGPFDRAEKLFKKSLDGILPPIVFPWEIIDENGFIKEEKFPRNVKNLQNLFRGIWERARQEVQAAQKISFVGLSMHQFLMDGLKYLFQNKTGNVEICVANPDNPVMERGKKNTYFINQPHCSAFAINQMLKSCAPNLNQMGWHEDSLTTGLFTITNDFESFVRTQMKPVVSR